MSNVELALKILVIWFVGLFLLAVGINCLTKKEYRKSFKELAVEHIRMTSVIGAVTLATGALGWFLFKVV